MMTATIIRYLEEFEDDLQPLQQALDDDGLDDYSDTLQSVLTKIIQLKNIVTMQCRY